ncbi:MAG: NrpR regulatory domain-containing protein [Kiritimatiellales bacterium]|nr:NrpR regulatory domain-containing protein [Kiritimatiellales bacterium]
MNVRNDKARAAVLRALSEFDGPAGAARIAARLPGMGVQLQPRTIRLYLAELDHDGLTTLSSRRKGRVLTERGRAELEHSDVIAKVGFVQGRIDTLGYRMAFNSETGKGTVIANFALVPSRDLSQIFAEIKPVFARNLSMGNRLCLIRANEKLSGRTIPGGYAALGTLCSVTVNGALMSEGIPATSRYGGLIEMRQGRPVRFVELMEYSGVTVDPLETFIRAGMTDVRGAAGKETGVITASFREIPSVALDDARRVFDRLQRSGMGGILMIGRPGQPLLDIPVAEGRTGFIVVGGLNPLAAVVEAGISCELKSLSGLEEFSLFSTFDETFRRYMDALR